MNTECEVPGRNSSAPPPIVTNTHRAGAVRMQPNPTPHILAGHCICQTRGAEPLGRVCLSAHGYIHKLRNALNGRVQASVGCVP